jgi:hypothetical protein
MNYIDTAKGANTMKTGELPNGERIFNRIEELTEYINNFPNSKLTPIFKKEVEYLETLRKDFPC